MLLHVIDWTLILLSALAVGLTFAVARDLIDTAQAWIVGKPQASGLRMDRRRVR